MKVLEKKIGESCNIYILQNKLIIIQLMSGLTSQFRLQGLLSWKTILFWSTLSGCDRLRNCNTLHLSAGWIIEKQRKELCSPYVLIWSWKQFVKPLNKRHLVVTRPYYERICWLPSKSIVSASRIPQAFHITRANCLEHSVSFIYLTLCSCLIWHFLFLVQEVSPRKEDFDNKLIRNIVSNSKYEREIRPTMNETEPIKVTFDMAYSQIVDLVSLISRKKYS